MIYQVGNTYTLNTQIFKDSLLHYHYEFEDSHYEIQDWNSKLGSCQRGIHNLYVFYS